MLALRHFVQTATFLGAPLTMTRIFWTFALHLRRVRRWLCEMLFPNSGVFPQMSHTDAMRGAGYQMPCVVPHGY